MSLFSDTDRKTLTPTLADSVPADSGGGEPHAIFRLMSFGAILSLLMALTVVSIFVVRLHPSPALPGTQSGQQDNSPRMVRVLDQYQNLQSPLPYSKDQGGGDCSGRS